jgi:phage shock protein E
MKKLAPFILIGILISGMLIFNFFKKEQQINAIPAEQAIENRIVDEGIIIDVRTQDEYEQGSLQDALIGYNFSSGEFEEKLDSLDKDKTYYLYCASGNRSGKAARLMTEKGFKNVNNLGGYSDLLEAGFEKQ